MPHNLFHQKELTYLPRRVVAGLVVGILWGFLPTDPASAAPKNAASGEAICRYAEPIPSVIDPCPLVKRAQALLPRLDASAARYLQKVASGFDAERSLRIQEALLREDLKWQKRGFTRRQIDLMVFVSLALSLDGADGRVAELEREHRESGEPKIQARLQAINLYRREALERLQALDRSLGKVSSHDLGFRF